MGQARASAHSSLRQAWLGPLAYPACWVDHRSEAGTGHAPQIGEAIMKLRTSLAAAGAAVVLGTTGALVLPAVASAHGTTHTLKFIAVQKGTVSFTRATGGIQDTDVNTTGKTIGFDMLYFAA